MPNMVRIAISPVVAVVTILAAPGGAAPPAARVSADKPTLETQLRRPVALLMADGLLLVGNRRSGTITVIEPASRAVVAEHAVAEGIADLAQLDDAILVLDDAAGQLLKVSVDRRGRSVRPIATVPITASKLAVARDRRRVFVTARWSHEVVSITLDADFERVKQQETIALPFAPHELLLVNGDETLLVADAFRGRIAIVDVSDGVPSRAPRVRRLDGHNIRGLALSADGEWLYVAHQRMVARALADYEELHWGRMVANGVRVLDVDAVLHGEPDELLEGWLDRHGGIGGATGDPGGVVTGPDGVLAMAFTGVGEVVVRNEDYVKRIPVQSRPEAMAIDGDRLYVANRFDDSVSVLDLDRGTLVETISLGPAPELTAVERGEKLFYDARLSHDSWISCHSCHTDGHTAGLLVDTLGDGDYGAPKRVPSLLGTRDTAPWGWTGSAATLAEQVGSSITTTLHGEPLPADRAADLLAYLESLEAPPSPGAGERELVRRGRELFSSRGCVDCHTPPTFTSDDTFDVGLADERHRRSFNPPSLRGVGQREERLFHDARAAGLEDVLVRFRHQLDDPLSKGDLAALLQYLRSL